MSQIFLDQNLVEPVMVESVVCRNNSINSYRLQLSLSNSFGLFLLYLQTQDPPGWQSWLEKSSEHNLHY
jgi:hypothetical protein